MDHGVVEQVGTPSEVYEHPATPFVYSFLGAVNRFEGRTENGILRVGDQSLTHGQDVAAARRVQAFARPHELQILTAPNAEGLSARVDRVLTFGASSRIELTGPGGQHLEAEVSRHEAAALNLQAGQNVKLSALRLSMFDAVI